MSSQLVLITGISGFIASHITEQLVEAGYRVRGTARGEKAKRLAEAVKLPGVEFVQVDDIAEGDFTEALKGVDILIHTASPMPGKASADDTIKGSVDGTLNVVRQASAAGIKKIIVTSSAASNIDPSLRPGFAGLTLTEKDWSPATRESVAAALATSPNPGYAYFASKALAERALWAFAKENPELDIATILPVFVYGPYAKSFPAPSSVEPTSTNAFPYKLISGGVPTTLPPWLADVRDVAKVHVLALKAPKDASTSPEGKRFVVTSPKNVTWREAADHLRKARPDLKILENDAIPALPGKGSVYDTSKTREILGIEFTAPEKTLEDLVDNLIELKLLA